MDRHAIVGGRRSLTPQPSRPIVIILSHDHCWVNIPNCGDLMDDFSHLAHVSLLLLLFRNPDFHISYKSSQILERLTTEIVKLEIGDRRS